VYIREMTIQDYAAVLTLWQSVDGVGLSDADSREAIGRYLARNPGPSYTVCKGHILMDTRKRGRE
jgi:hypothetical protein